MPEDIVVVGAGGFGRETLDVIEAINAVAGEPPWRIAGVVDDGPADVQKERLSARGYRYLGSLSECLETHGGATWIVAIGSPSVRARVSTKLEACGVRSTVLVHPSAVIGSQVELSAGTVVCGGVHVSTNVRLGEHVHLNPGVIIGHDAVLSAHVSVNPGAVVSGEVLVGARTLIGAASMVLQGLVVGEEALVGAGACVTRDVPAGLTVVGVPARAFGGARV